MPAYRILKRDDAAAFSTCKITIETGLDPLGEYVVVSHTEHLAKDGSSSEASQTRTFHFMEPEEAIEYAKKMVRDAEAEGYRLSENDSFLRLMAGAKPGRPAQSVTIVGCHSFIGPSSRMSYVKVTLPTNGEAEQFLSAAFDNYQWERIDESQVPEGTVFRKRWPGVAMSVLPERRKRSR